MTYIAKYDHQEVGTFQEFEGALEYLHLQCDLNEQQIEELYDSGGTSFVDGGFQVDLEIEEQDNDKP